MPVRISFGLRIFLASWMIFLAGCVTLVPEGDLADFRDGFLEIEKAGNAVYDLVEPAWPKDKAPTETCTKERSEALKCFNPLHHRLRTDHADEPASLRQRRLALALLPEYALALVELADGTSGQELRSRLRRIGELTTAIAALAGAPISAGIAPFLTGPVAAGFGVLASQLRTAGDQMRLRTVLTTQHGTVTALVDMLIADTAPMYGLYRVHLTSPPQLTTLSPSERNRMLTQYKDMLGAYVLILRQAKSANGSLVDTARSGRTGMTAAQATIDQAALIKASAEAFWKTAIAAKR